MKYFASRICNFYMQKLSTAAAAAAAAAAKKLLKNTYNKKKNKNFLGESQFLIPKF